MHLLEPTFCKDFVKFGETVSQKVLWVYPTWGGSSLKGMPTQGHKSYILCQPCGDTLYDYMRCSNCHSKSQPFDDECLSCEGHWACFSFLWLLIYFSFSGLVKDYHCKNHNPLSYTMMHYESHLLLSPGIIVIIFVRHVEAWAKVLITFIMKQLGLSSLQSVELVSIICDGLYLLNYLYCLSDLSFWSIISFCRVSVTTSHCACLNVQSGNGLIE